MNSPYVFFDATVASVTDLCPSLRRVTVTGPSLADFADPGWDQRLKLVLPATCGYECLPRDDDQWYRAWQLVPATHQPPLRTYTTRAVRHDVVTGQTEVDIDMVRHDLTHAGPAARWLEDCRPGEHIVLLGPSRRCVNDAAPRQVRTAGLGFVPPLRTDSYLLGGDETAAPAIARIVEDLPASARGIAVVEMPHRDDAGYFPSHPGIEMRVYAREGAPHGSSLVPAVVEAASELAPPGCRCDVEEIDVDTQMLWEVPRHAKGGAALVRTSMYAWLAGEASAVRAMRRHLVSERGVDRRSVAFMGYWRQGRSEH